MKRFLLLPTLSLVPFVAALAQDPAPPVGPQPQPQPQPQQQAPRTIEDLYGEWLDLDGVAIVVNSDIITETAIFRKLQLKQAEAKVTTTEELMQLRVQTSREEVEELLIRQAGEDLGLAPEAVEAHVMGVLRDEQDEAGGAFEMARKLREEDTTATEIREDRVAEIYEMSWKRRIAGYGGAGERSPEDRYVRPGRMSQRYKRIGRTGLDIEYLMRAGATPATYELQGLLLSGEAYGSLEAAAQKASDLLVALRAGQVEWEDMIDELGRLPNRGLSGARDIRFIRQALDPGDNRLVQFVMEAEQDVFSDVIRFPLVNPATGERVVAGFIIYKLLDRKPAHLPDFGQPDVQRDLRRFIEREGDELRWNDAVAELQATAYVWYPGIEQQRAAAEEARQKRLDAIQEAREKNAERLRKRPAAESSGD